MTGPMPTRRSWWQANKLALLSLLFVLPLAISASSFRLATTYLPWTYYNGHTGDGPVRLQQAYVANEVEIRIDVTVELTVAKPFGDIGGVTAVPGATLWGVKLHLSAAPDVVLDNCSIKLVDSHGDLYGTAGGKNLGTTAYASGLQCVPEGAEGPSYDYFTQTITPSAKPRPASWDAAAVIAVPSNVKPVAVRIFWHEPDYVELTIP